MLRIFLKGNGVQSPLWSDGIAMEITRRKILALPPLLTEGKTLNGDRFLLEFKTGFLFTALNLTR